MTHLSIDLETYSDQSIQDVGAFKYIESSAFEILLFAYAVDEAPARVVDLAQGERIPEDILTALTSPDVVKHAYNASFEWYALAKHLGMTVEERNAWLSQWQCTMLHGMYAGYPRGLSAVGDALGLTEDKRKLAAGKALIRLFCCPQKPTRTNGNRTRIQPYHEPEKWLLFKEYNAQDVEAERAVERLLAAFPVPADVQAQWRTDLTINARGVAVDLDLVDGALRCSDTVNGALAEEAHSLTGLANPNSVGQLTEWLRRELEDDSLTTLRKDDVQDILDRGVESIPAARMLEIRQQLSKTSCKKYEAMHAAASADGRIRGCLMFYGANRTGRWAGRIVQPQNLPRTYMSASLQPLARSLVKRGDLDSLTLLFGTVPDTLSQLIRTALVPTEGNVFLDADFSAIEARVIAWLAGEQWRLDVFKSHGKIYEASASQMFGVPIELIKKGNPEYAYRARGKVAELALGYQGGVGAMRRMDVGHNLDDLSDGEVKEIVMRWRAASPNIRDLWYAFEEAAIGCLQDGRPRTLNRGVVFDLIEDFDTHLRAFRVTLPSGRQLHYASPFLASDAHGRATFRFWGNDGTTKKWSPTDTYGGKLVENIVQAIARDCLAVNIERLEQAGFPVVFHVHDEVIIDYHGDPDKGLAEVCRIMGQPIEWAPDLPLRAEGWHGEYFTKD